MNDAMHFADALGHRLRRVREDRGMTTAEVASRSRVVGLNWDRATVSRIELGQRQVTVAELFLLSALYAYPMSALLPTERVQLSQVIAVEPETLQTALNGTPLWFDRDQVQEILEKAAQHFESLGLRLEAIYPGANQLIAAEAATDPDDQAVKDAAKRLQVDAWDVKIAARLLWNRPLTDERDHRANDTVTTKQSARTKQARRGHITRQLLGELAPILPRLRSTHPADFVHPTDNRDMED